MRRNGLTIFEFLVVFLIVLLAIQFIYHKFIHPIRRSVPQDMLRCLAHVKQLGGALFLYENDFKSIPTFHANPEQIHTSQDEVARSLALLFTTGYADDPSLYECPMDHDRQNDWQTQRPHTPSDAITGADAFAAVLALENPEQGTSYLLTPNFHIRDRSNKPILADRGGEATADGYTTLHGDTDTTRGEWGGSVLMRDNSVRWLRNPNGYIPHSAGNETIPLWINTNTDTVPLTDRNRATIWK